MSKQDFMKVQSCVLRVNIHCDGCKQKVRKLLQKIEGVYSISIDAEQGKVMVSGNVDPSLLIEKLVKSGKHAELWGGNNKDKKGLNNFQNFVGNMKIEKGNGGKDNKSKNNGQQHQMQQLKGIQDMKLKNGNDQKSVKFKLPEEEFDGSDDFDEFDDEDYDGEFTDEDDDDEFSHGNGHGQNLRNGSHGSGNMMKMMNGFAMNEKSGGGGAGAGGKGKKGGDFELPVVMKGLGEKNDKKGKGGKKGGAGGEKNKKGGNKKECSKEKHGGGGLISKVVGGLLGHGKSCKSDKKDSGNGGAAGGNKNGKGGKKGGGKTDGGHEKSKKQQNFHEIDITKPTKGGSGAGAGAGGKMGYMGQMGGQMGRTPAVQGLPAQPTTMNGGGYYQGMNGLPMAAPSPAMGGAGGYYYQGMGLGNPYTQNQQQQYMAMMMNQQMMMDGRAHQFHPRPAAVNYGGMMAAPPQQHPMGDPYTHYFSDENTGSCNIM